MNVCCRKDSFRWQLNARIDTNKVAQENNTGHWMARKKHKESVLLSGSCWRNDIGIWLKSWRAKDGPSWAGAHLQEKSAWRSIWRCSVTLTMGNGGHITRFKQGVNVAMRTAWISKAKYNSSNWRLVFPSLSAFWFPWQVSPHGHRRWWVTEVVSGHPYSWRRIIQWPWGNGSMGQRFNGAMGSARWQLAHWLTKTETIRVLQI